jgi:hypothetical protein
MSKRKNGAVRVLYVKDTDDLKTIYAKARRAFTAADLQKYTEIEEPGIPMEQVIAELEAIQREEAPRRTKKKQADHARGGRGKRTVSNPHVGSRRRKPSANPTPGRARRSGR